MTGQDELFDVGLGIRRDVLGADYVDGSLARADEFMMAFQRLTTEWCWGDVWSARASTAGRGAS